MALVRMCVAMTGGTLSDDGCHLIHPHKTTHLYWIVSFKEKLYCARFIKIALWMEKMLKRDI